MTYTPQEAFDKVCAHIKTQGRPSVKQRPHSTKEGDVFCVYRATNGDKCAIGALISDDEYSPTMEASDVLGIIDNFKIPSLQGLDSAFLKHLQLAHDTYSTGFKSEFVARVLSELTVIADVHRLNADAAAPTALGAT